MSETHKYGEFWANKTPNRNAATLQLQFWNDFSAQQWSIGWKPALNYAENPSNSAPNYAEKKTKKNKKFELLWAA